MLRVILILFILISTSISQNIWINEFHYDNVGSDVNEFIEVAGSAGTDLSGWTVALYNGGSGTVYKTISLAGLITDDGSGSGALSFFEAGIQNGASDGFALVNSAGIVMEFLSYEGTINAVSGPAIGMTSTDVGVSETSATPVGQSLQLSGKPFSWIGPSTASPGLANLGQVLPVELISFSASYLEKNIELLWETATEVNNYGFEVERKNNEGEWNILGFVDGHGNSNSPKFYSFKDKTSNQIENYYYRLKQIDIDGQYTFSSIVEVNIELPAKFEISQNYPNPFNPSTTISFSILERTEVTIRIYNVLGEVVHTLVNEYLEAGNYKYNFDASSFSSGTYFYRVTAGSKIETRKMLLIK